ncbi:FAD binding domain protein [Zalerion maritima]|uniref:FAD binding domain protein n=1 Tax=Zalerion maritima TaxID=339359 RepID=A0AAD5RU09_9PEZI|nr:FAD binding domain protein [Zalerion maritima]
MTRPQLPRLVRVPDTDSLSEEGAPKALVLPSTSMRNPVPAHDELYSKPIFPDTYSSIVVVKMIRNMEHLSKPLASLSQTSLHWSSRLGRRSLPLPVRYYSQARTGPKVAVIGEARDQGGSLDLHPDGGQAALKLAGLFPQFQALSRPEGEVLKIYLPDGKLIMDEGSDPETQGRPQEMHNRPEIDRRLLRKMLLDSLEPGTVKWGTKVKTIQTKKVGAREVFSIQVEAHEETRDDRLLLDYDLVVGADGAFSRVRHLLTPARPYFSGIAGLDVRISSADTSRPAQVSRCGKGMCLTLGPNRGILSQRSGGGAGEVRTYAFVRMASEGLGSDWESKCGIDFRNMKTAIPQFLHKFYSGWDEGARDMVLNADVETATPRSMWMLEPGLKWETRPGVTLLGDAAHVMTPFAGVGVNVAMQDSLFLAQRILAHLSSDARDPSMAQAIKEYESEMFERAEQHAKQTLMYLDLFFHNRGGVAMVEHFDKVKAEEKAASAYSRGESENETGQAQVAASG